MSFDVITVTRNWRGDGKKTEEGQQKMEPKRGGTQYKKTSHFPIATSHFP